MVLYRSQDTTLPPFLRMKENINNTEYYIACIATEKYVFYEWKYVLLYAKCELILAYKTVISARAVTLFDI